MNFKKIIRNVGKIVEKIKRDSFSKLLISQLLSVLECQTWFLINAKTHHVYQIIQYANNLIYSFKNIDETMRNSRKITGKLRRYTN